MQVQISILIYLVCLCAAVKFFLSFLHVDISFCLGSFLIQPFSRFSSLYSSCLYFFSGTHTLGRPSSSLCIHLHMYHRPQSVQFCTVAHSFTAQCDAVWPQVKKVVLPVLPLVIHYNSLFTALLYFSHLWHCSLLPVQLCLYKSTLHTFRSISIFVFLLLRHVCLPLFLVQLISRLSFWPFWPFSLRASFLPFCPAVHYYFSSPSFYLPTDSFPLCWFVFGK